MSSSSAAAPESGGAGPELVLASSSVHRRALLARFGLPFRCVSPGIDETARPAEPPARLVERLAAAKAAAVAARLERGLVIGSDQVAVVGSQVLGKPGGRTAALAQLRAASGRRVRFLTGLCVLDAASGREAAALVPTEVDFRRLGEAEIAAYVDAEQPFECAGSFRVEGPGIALFERVSSDDPTALVGLPLIALSAMLRHFGLNVLLSRPDATSPSPPPAAS